MKPKYLLPFALLVVFCASAVAQTVTITPKKDVFLRTKPLSDYKKAFTVIRPIAKAATPAVTRKINTVLSPESIFGLDLNEEIYRSQWLDSIDFETLYNKDGIICVKEWMEGSGAYPDGTTRYVVVDAKTGSRINIPDAFINLPGVTARLQVLQQVEIKERIKELKEDPETKDEDTAELFKDKKLGVEDLKEYSVSADGVTFYYEYRFPHVIRAFEPLGEFKLSWAELKPFIKPDGLLARFVR